MGAMNVVMTVISLLLVEVAGRKTLLLSGFAGMFVCTVGVMTVISLLLVEVAGRKTLLLSGFAGMFVCTVGLCVANIYVSIIIIIIISVIGRPLLNIGLPLRSPQIPVGGDLHPASSDSPGCFVKVSQTNKGFSLRPENRARDLKPTFKRGSRDKKKKAQISWVSYLCIALVILFVVMFAVGPGSIPWFLVTELFNQSARPAATSVAVTVNWTANFIVGLSFLPLSSALGPNVFIIFAVLQLLFIMFIFFKVPETKNKTVEEITAMFRQQM
ncbi:hypothetical protein B5X24_HaOG206052 [Helicoverpa armigera]|uniref:Major facilitator superfamily (MFS) profile domain-containing protein n=1 Tax=Helicoverpa armigera TaxID=29058 RepID=A0A2W1BUL5_HELAM|nr:hypothetical protein B5X24_HaOG206052 [Helicoverpa armigera]